MKYDIIIIGSGISGLYAAYNIKKMSPDTSFLILEKYKKQWIGGRTSNEMFYGTEIVTGAGVGRKKKDKLLHKLLDELGLKTPEFTIKPYYSTMFHPLDVKKVMIHLRNEYEKYQGPQTTFKTFATNVLGEKTYKQFLLSVGYTDFEKEDAYDTLHYYGMEDNYCCSTGFNVPWRKMVLRLADEIGESHFKFSSNVSELTKTNNTPCEFVIDTEGGKKYTCNKVIVATTITGVRKLLPNPIYNDIEGQPFLRLYGKFSKQSIPIMKEYVKGYTFLPGPLQKILPINPDAGIYMIAYNDNNNTLALKNNLDNTKDNRDMYCELLEKSLGIPPDSLDIVAIKDFYWPIGTHYYKPLNLSIFKDRESFIDIAQHPGRGILVVGEVVSKNQGWTNGALDSVRAVLTKKWINSVC
ncbi:MAG: NAD(P)-binding protein [Candidatus Marinimicrobia bacterium]|nr:NAD(P)-binding protein [Candidatus Neomarinimicrobiota bacterium]